MTTGHAAALVALAAFAAHAADQRTVPEAGRVRPPETLQCERDRLTAYTGAVTRLTREQTRTIIEIRTDWDTTERVVIRHAAEGPEHWFVLREKPFGAEGWKVIESSPGQLRPAIRATAWVCEDGRNPIVDWNPAAEPPPPGP